jgi:dethiobiotin synthetase
MIVLLITGTDTGVGKTWVGRALSHALVAAGRRVVAVKPVETGCEDDGSHLEDGALLAAATGQAEPRRALIRFRTPVTPALAAERDGSGEPIDLDALVLQIEAVSGGADVLLVEGAGGLLSPITWEWTAADLARSLGAVALVVAADRLGSINHTQLTLSALELAGLDVVGVVFTAPEAPDASTGTNPGAIARLSGLEHVLALPRVADPSAVRTEIAPVLEWMDRGLRQ